MRKFALAAVAALLACVGAQAQTPGAEFGSPGSVGNGDTGPWTLGWAFRVNNAPINVTHLGYYDHLGDGLGQSHDVGLWDINGNLLASLTVPAGTSAPLTGHFRYVQLGSAVMLSANQTYVVGGVSGGQGGGDFYTWNTVGFFTAPEITFVGDRWAGGGVLTFPINISGVANGFFGANFMHGEIPAPGALALLGAAGLVSRRRRRN